MLFIFLAAQQAAVRSSSLEKTTAGENAASSFLVRVVSSFGVNYVMVAPTVLVFLREVICFLFFSAFSRNLFPVGGGFQDFFLVPFVLAGIGRKGWTDGGKEGRREGSAAPSPNPSPAMFFTL